MNKVCLLGRISTDLDLKTTTNKISVVRFNIAVSRQYTGTDGQRETDFFSIVAWRNTAEFICNYFKKGQMVAVDGSLQVNKYETKDGEKRSTIEVLANNVFFCGDNKKDEQPKEKPKTEPKQVEMQEISGDDLPF